MIERHFDIPFIANMAFREKQIQQNYRPIIAVHKWFARRPGTLFRGLLLSEFSDKPLQDAFYASNRFAGLKVADPFMGGGTPLLEANRIGCDVIGFDINPMSYWIVKQEIEHLDLDTYVHTAHQIRKQLEKEIGKYYRTQCLICGNEESHVKYFLWVKTIQCDSCHEEIQLFPSYLMAGNSRHPKNVFICSCCGQLTETVDRRNPGACGHCGANLSLDGPARRNRCICPNCRTINSFPRSDSGPPRHRLFAIEYFCPLCKGSHTGRYFKSPDLVDLERVAEIESKWAKTLAKFVPPDLIPAGDETNRLHRWGYRHYHQMFNARQLIGLELSARLITNISNERIRNALATNLSDLLRYQNMLCRYDTMALKSLDIFSVHGFPVGLIQCESNLLGIFDPGRNNCVGSGGWANIVEKFRKAKTYCDAPFEIRHKGRYKDIVPVPGEWIGDSLNGRNHGEQRTIEINCLDAGMAELPASSLDGVFTDPPYLGNVQYAELMDFCYVWLRRLLGDTVEAFKKESTRSPQELTGNVEMGRGLEHFALGLASVFRRMADALKPGAPMAFTYHHNDISAYYPVAVAILDAGLTCSASLPCPAEMGASIHINGTGSSIIDTVFICRTTGVVPKKWLTTTRDGVANLVGDDLAKLRAGQVKPTMGDIRCITYGHLIRLAIWNLRKNWNRHIGIDRRLATVASWLNEFGGWSIFEEYFQDIAGPDDPKPLFAVREDTVGSGYDESEISF